MIRITQMLHDVNACCLLSIFNSLHNAQCIYRYIVSEIRTLFDEWSWSIFKILFAESIEILNKNNILNNNLNIYELYKYKYMKYIYLLCKCLLLKLDRKPRKMSPRRESNPQPWSEGSLRFPCGAHKHFSAFATT